MVKPRPTNDRGSPIAPTHDVMFVQEAMRSLGLYHGPVDGIPGAKTMGAVAKYKRRHGLFVDKTMDADFVAHVRERT